MDYKSYVEDLLSTYNDSTEQLKSKQQMYEYIMGGLHGMPLDYDKVRISCTNVITSSTEDYALLLAQIADTIKWYEDRINLINNLIRCLNQIELLVIEYRFIDNEHHTWKEIGKLVDRDEIHCIKIKKRAIIKLVDYLLK